MIDYPAILTRQYRHSEWTLNGDDYSGLAWLSDDEQPTQKTLDNLWPSVQQQIADELTAKATAKQALLNRLGITSDEAKWLLS